MQGRLVQSLDAAGHIAMHLVCQSIDVRNTQPLRRSRFSMLGSRRLCLRLFFLVLRYSTAKRLALEIISEVLVDWRLLSFYRGT